MDANIRELLNGLMVSIAMEALSVTIYFIITVIALESLKKSNNNISLDWDENTWLPHEYSLLSHYLF
ncbi:hypothetical protein KFK09_002697 [Dendrobium nobile]|uniref:Uncharacterized protein n=1 Tax=Dendrobium nobile TaxID=94219 RepID=A0A8T3C4J4_DENNO|nr:hypothetical protein KFK09_002697 [Dendrobium nobile]